ncbi:MAG: hypothetical protein M1820_006631 [Bogoriella megaspora]|nr:MAG: hypothetical protein M1820_006631 [Bogoriella megaspora]
MAARPILASTIFDSLKHETSHSKKQSRLKFGCASLDSALGDGFPYDGGGLICISGDSAIGKSLISSHLLASHILSSPTNLAAIIDSTNSFDIVRLHDVLRTRAHDEITLAKTKSTANDEQPPVHHFSAENVDHLLDRVSITPVFDFTGMRDAIREFSDLLSQARNNTAAPQPSTKPPSALRTEIPDSEESSPEDPPPPPPPPTKPTLPPPLGLLLIDNLTSIAQPPIRTNHTTGHALLSSFLRELRHIASTHSLLAILINHASAPPAIPSTTSLSSNPTTSFHTTSFTTSFNTSFNQPSTSYRSPSQPQLPSIFSSNKVVPMLNPSLDAAVDMHLLVSKLPRGERDARVWYGKGGGKVELVRVVEVLLDRREGREGRWGSWVVKGDGVGIEGLG